MEVRKLTCPSCGAQVDIPADLSTAHCVYCGSKLLVERPDEAERKAIETHLQLGRIALEAGNCQEALEHFNEALEADPNNVETWVAKAWATHGLTTTADDRLDEALRYIDKALELDSENVAAKQAKEEIKRRHSFWLNLLGNEEWELAVEIAKIYAESAWDVLSLNPVQKEQTAPHVLKALEYFHRAFTLNPNLLVALQNIVLVLNEPVGRGYADPMPYAKAAKFLQEGESIRAELIALREELSELERQKQQGGFGLLDRRRGQYSRVKKRIAELESLVEAAAALGIDAKV